MSNLIDRQAAIDRLTEYGNGRAVFISVGEAIIRIKQLPPIQPEIMRCGDGCKFWDKLAGEPKGMCYILRQCTRDSFYCGNAMRREDGENNESN